MVLPALFLLNIDIEIIKNLLYVIIYVSSITIMSIIIAQSICTKPSKLTIIVNETEYKFINDNSGGLEAVYNAIHEKMNK